MPSFCYQQQPDCITHSDEQSKRKCKVTTDKTESTESVIEGECEIGIFREREERNGRKN
jgi:hypothetical protein